MIKSDETMRFSESKRISKRWGLFLDITNQQSMTYVFENGGCPKHVFFFCEGKVMINDRISSCEDSNLKRIRQESVYYCFGSGFDF